METLDHLTGELAWMRRLAQALLKDAAIADDVAQDAWLAAAGKAPVDRPVRPWLSRVVRNVVRMRARSARRRAAYEAAVDLGADVPQPDAIVARIEAQRLLAGEVLALDEPYRSTVLLHYFEGLTSAEIARRLGIPGVTVRRRLQIALDRLRAQLDQGHGNDRKAWIASLAAVARYRGLGDLVGAKPAMGALAFAVIAVIAVIWLADHRRDPAGGLARTGSAGSAADHAPGARASLAPPDRDARPIAGTVVFEGQPVPGAAVALHVATQREIAIAEAVTGPAGTFRFRVPRTTSYVVTASAPGHSPAISGVELEDPRVQPEALVLALGDCTWRTVGTVADTEGVAIPRAVLRIDAVVGVDSDADGHYELCRPAGSALVTVSAAGYGRVTAELEFRGAIRRDFTLAPEAVLVGRVVREGTDAAVVDARVVAVPAENSTSRASMARALPASSAQTDSIGGFQITGLAPGRFRVEATAPGRGSEVLEADLEAGVSKEIEITMAARARLSGRVTASGAPVSGARVTAIAPQPGTAAVGWSQADGSFAVEGVPHGVVRWEVRGHDVGAAFTTRVDRDEVSGVVLEVTPAAAIRGRVTAGGVAVVDAEVSCDRVDWTHGFSVVSQSARSDIGGNYTIDDAAPGECPLEVTSAALGARSGARTLVVARGAVTRADVELALEASVTGVVVDPSGEPAAMVYVRLEADDDAGEAMTDDRGSFTIRGLRGGGDYRPAVSPAPIDGARFPTPGGGELAAVRVPGPRATISGVRLVVRNDRATIRGKVLDDHGLPVSDVRVQIETGAVPDAGSERTRIVVKTMPPWFRPNLGMLGTAPSTMTDRLGHFELRDVAPGRYDLRAYGGDGATAAVYQVATGAAETAIRLPRAGAIEGTLVGFTEATTVFATDHRYRPESAVSQGHRFRFRGLSPGTYSVVASDGTAADARVIEVRAGAIARLELHGRGNGRIEGRVVELGGGPVAGARCFAAAAAGGFAPWWSSDLAAITDGDGRFELDPVPAGSVHVECLGSGWARTQRELTVAAGRTPTAAQLAIAHAQEPRSNPGFRMLNEQLPPTVVAVDRDGAAAKAGLAVGDEIVAIDGVRVEPFGSGGLGALLAGRSTGALVALSVVRGSTSFVATLVMP